jgi:Holliday junction resolvase RusA-like endonuclease
MLAFEIPGEPVGKARPRFLRKTGLAYTPKKTESYENRVAAAAQHAMANNEPWTGPVKLECRAVYLHPQSWSAKKKAGADWKTSKPDADNILKIVKDAMNKIVFHDDAQVVYATIQKRYGPIAKLVVVVTDLTVPAAEVVGCGVAGAGGESEVAAGVAP